MVETVYFVQFSWHATKIVRWEATRWNGHRQCYQIKLLLWCSVRQFWLNLNHTPCKIKFSRSSSSSSVLKNWPPDSFKKHLARTSVHRTKQRQFDVMMSGWRHKDWKCRLDESKDCPSGDWGMWNAFVFLGFSCLLLHHLLQLLGAFLVNYLHLPYFLKSVKFQVLRVWNTRTQSSGASSCVVYMYLLPFQVEGCAVF